MPSRELPANGLDVEACVREAFDSLGQRRGHGPDGRFTAENTDAGTTLARSAMFWREVSAVRAALVAQVAGDLAATEGAPATLDGLIGAYAEVRLLRAAMFERLTQLGGPITSKGRARALYTAYLSALDRETKLAGVLGLERRPKHVPTLAEHLREGD